MSAAVTVVKANRKVSSRFWKVINVWFTAAFVMNRSLVL
jgi:hypothetical protein